MSDIVLDADLIEKHYNSLISSTSQITDPISVVYDRDTTLSVSSNSEQAYLSALSVQKGIEQCIDTDAEHLKMLGVTLFKEDEDISADIDSILNFD